MFSCLDYAITVKTEPTKAYNFTWLSAPKSTFKFRVLSCSEARLAFTSKPNNLEQSYELIIGADSNQKTELYKNQGETPVAMDISPNILDCNSYQDFWVEWSSNGVFKCGLGDEAGADVFLEYTDDNPVPVYFISLTSGLGVTQGSTWNFNDDIGNLFVLDFSVHFLLICPRP